MYKESCTGRMRYLRLLSVSFLLTFALAGCHRKPVRVAPPPQAQAPIVTTLPPIPPLRLPDVDLAKSQPAPPPPKPAAPVPAKPKQTAHKRHHRFLHRKPSEKPESNAHAAETENAGSEAQPTSSTGTTANPALGQLSADDAAANPNQKDYTQRLIRWTQSRLKKLSSNQRARHKDDVAQVKSFLKQAEQAWNMNDLVGAQTLATKAKILMDELTK